MWVVSEAEQSTTREYVENEVGDELIIKEVIVGVVVEVGVYGKAVCLDGKVTNRDEQHD